MYLIGNLLIVFSWFCGYFIYKKLGLRGWEFFIPGYNLYVLSKKLLGNGWYCLLILIPIVGVIYSIILIKKLVYSLGGGFTMFLITLLTPFGLIILAFSKKYKYIVLNRTKEDIENNMRNAKIIADFLEENNMLSR